MKYILPILAVFLFAGTAFAATGLTFVQDLVHGNQTITKYQDTDKGNTCYVVTTATSTAISCIKDSPVQAPCHPTPEFRGC